jgi:hypothetical protein
VPYARIDPPPLALPVDEPLAGDDYSRRYDAVSAIA